MPEYRGLADSLGVEYIVTRELTNRDELRCRMNGQRHAILFQVECSEKIGTLIRELVEVEPKLALLILKSVPGLGVSSVKEAERIPFYEHGEEARLMRKAKKIINSLQKELREEFKETNALQRARNKAVALMIAQEERESRGTDSSD